MTEDIYRAVFHHFIDEGYTFDDFLVEDEKMQIVRVQKRLDSNFCCVLYNRELLPENFETVMFNDDVEEVPALDPVQHVGQVLEIKQGTRIIGVLYRYVKPPYRELAYLQNWSDSISEVFAKTLFRSIAIGLLGLHNQGYAHRYLNLSNLAYSISADGVVTGHIIGYSLRKVSDSSLGLENLYEYMNPIEDESQPKDYFKRDVWMLGAVMMITISGMDCFLQFRSDNIARPNDMAMIDLYTKDLHNNLMKRLLNYHPSFRYTMEEAVNDPWWNPTSEGEVMAPVPTVPLTRIQQELERSGITAVGKISQGAYGKVYKVVLSGRLLEKFPEHQTAAMKMASLNESPWYRNIASRREIVVIKNIQHKNIVRMIKVFDFPNYLIIVMELAKGSLRSKIRRDVVGGRQAEYVEEKFKPWIKGACEGLQFLHRTGYAHRDLKPDNILINMNDVAVLCDFSFSRMVDENELSTTFCGTMRFSAPQIVRREKYKPKPADCWSMGVTIYECLTGKMLIKNTFLFNRKCAQRTRKVQNSVMSPEAKILVYNLLWMEEDDRWTMDVALSFARFFPKETESGTSHSEVGVPVAGPSRQVTVDVEPAPRGRPVGGHSPDAVIEQDDSDARLDPPRTPPMQRSSIFYATGTEKEVPKQRKYDTYRR